MWWSSKQGIGNTYFWLPLSFSEEPPIIQPVAWIFRNHLIEIYPFLSSKYADVFWTQHVLHYIVTHKSIRKEKIKHKRKNLPHDLRDWSIYVGFKAFPNYKFGFIWDWQFKRLNLISWGNNLDQQQVVSTSIYLVARGAMRGKLGQADNFGRRCKNEATQRREFVIYQAKLTYSITQFSFTKTIKFWCRYVSGLRQYTRWVPQWICSLQYFTGKYRSELRNHWN